MRQLNCATRKGDKYFFNIHTKGGKKNTLIVEITGFKKLSAKINRKVFLLDLAYSGAVDALKERGYKVIKKREGVYYYGKS